MPIRIVLDTAAARGVIYGDAPATPLEEFPNPNQSVSFALADNAVVEVALALYEERFSWDVWTSRVRVIDRLLDRRSPIFPDDEEIRKIWIGPKPIVSPGVPRQEHMRAIWELLRRARTPADLASGPTFTGSDGHKYRIESSEEVARRLAEWHRDRWRETIEKIQGQLQGTGAHPTQEYVAELLFDALLRDQPEEALLRMRHDGYVKTYSRFVSLALQPKSPYNPRSPRRQGDSFDIELIRALALPAIICTLDDRLRRHVLGSGSVQARQVVTPQELLDDVAAGILEQRIPEVLRDRSPPPN